MCVRVFLLSTLGGGKGGIYKGNEGTHGLSLDFRAHLIGDVP